MTSRRKGCREFGGSQPAAKTPHPRAVQARWWPHDGRRYVDLGACGGRGVVDGRERGHVVLRGYRGTPFFHAELTPVWDAHGFAPPELPAVRGHRCLALPLRLLAFVAAPDRGGRRVLTAGPTSAKESWDWAEEVRYGVPGVTCALCALRIRHSVPRIVSIAYLVA